MKVGIMMALFGRQTLDQALEIVAKAGVEAVEIGTGNYPGSPHCPVDELLQSQVALNNWKAKIRDKGLEISALSCHGNPLHPDRKLAEAHHEVHRKTVKLVCTRAAMGTHVAVTALGRSPGQLQEAVGRAFEEMDRLIALLTRYEPASPVSVLNSTGRLDGPPQEVSEVVAGALGFHKLSSGAFDVSVAPLLALFESRLDRPDAAPPSQAEFREALALVGAEHLALSPRQIGFARPGMSVTLDGIAKGYIVDAVGIALGRRGVTRHLVDAGGDIRARGTKEKGAPWTVGVRDPAGSAAFPDAIHLANGAVATSGSYEQSSRNRGPSTTSWIRRAAGRPPTA